MSDVLAEPTEPAPVAPRARLRWWKEVLYAVAVYGVYSFVRNRFGSAGGDAHPAFGHAKDIVHIERWLHLYFEPHLQRWYLDLPGKGLIRGWNVYYGIAHFVVTFLVLVLLFRRDKDRYPLWRNALGLTTCLAVVGFAVYSLMPPRLLDDAGQYGGCQIYAQAAAKDLRAKHEHTGPGCHKYGFVDTVDRYGGWISFGNEGYKNISNQYAAMPSMHIGWSTWCALVLVPMLKKRWKKLLAALYPVLTLLCIVVTGNHYWIDGAGGLVCLGGGFLLARALTGRFARRQPARVTGQTLTA